jgi:hemerythrin
MPNGSFVAWDEKYSTGIQLIDDQHKELLKLTNDLFSNCQEGDQSAGKAFRRVVHAAVDYVKYHFSAEEKIFENINYPLAAEHKRQHESFVKRVLEDAKSFEEGKSIVPINFAKFLREWILTHIAVHDKQFADFIQGLKRKGMLNLTRADE